MNVVLAHEKDTKVEALQKRSHTPISYAFLHGTNQVSSGIGTALFSDCMPIIVIIILHIIYQLTL